MGVNCCSESKRGDEFDQEVVLNRSPIKKKSNSLKPLDEDTIDTERISLKNTRSYEVHNNEEYTLMDFPAHGRSKPEEVQIKTRVVKLGKKVRR
jgi:hypothetical protein